MTSEQTGTTTPATPASQTAQAAHPEAAPPRTANATDAKPEVLLKAKVYPVLSSAKLSSMDFAPPVDCNYFSWSPMKAFKARDSGQLGPGGELETLQTYLNQKELRSTAADILLEVHLFKLPNPNALVTIYRVASTDSGSDFGAILPGAAVSESLSRAQWFADDGQGKTTRLLSTKVFPDELVTHGNPHEFIYVPRSVKTGFDRYLADVKREQESELARVRKSLPSLT